jgi:hypothetical protein
MAQLTRELDGRFLWDWSKWPVPTMPDIPSWQGPWNRDISSAPVDERTRDLAAVDVPISAHAGAPPWEGSTYGMPISLCDARGATTPVWDFSRPVKWNWFTPTFPITQVPLPLQVRREGDPVGSSDRHAYLVDPKNRVLIEMICVERSPLSRLQTWGQCDWTVGYPGGGPGIARYDMSVPYSAKAPHGIVAAGTPQLPMVPRWQEIERGVIDHAIFGALANTAPGHVGWARGGDGSWKGYPIHTGDLLRLRPEVVARFAHGTPARVIAEALHTHGLFIGDRSSTGDPTKVGGGIALTQDRRWSTGDGTFPRLELPLRLAEFDIIQPAK